ncbi:hypothetical protein ABIF00_000074 [Bradyrhizobium elkanii]
MNNLGKPRLWRREVPAHLRALVEMFGFGQEGG